MRFGRVGLAGFVVYSALAFGGEVNADEGELSIRRDSSPSHVVDIAVFAGTLLGTAASCRFKPARRISDYVAKQFRDVVIYWDNSTFSS